MKKPFRLVLAKDLLSGYFYPILATNYVKEELDACDGLLESINKELIPIELKNDFIIVYEGISWYVNRKNGEILKEDDPLFEILDFDDVNYEEENTVWRKIAVKDIRDIILGYHNEQE